MLLVVSIQVMIVLFFYPELIQDEYVLVKKRN
jgi:hypothetical protein